VQGAEVKGQNSELSRHTTMLPTSATSW
jgi:hypothetical protein